jgi:two-component system LytT family response regulator
MEKNKFRTIIVDDEAPARELLKRYIAEIPGVELIAECSNGFDAVKAISELHPEVVILDIQMPKLNGFEVIELLDELPYIIFSTAYDEFALKAFEVHAIDYLLKPYSLDRLKEAFQHIQNYFSKTQLQSLKEISTIVQSKNVPIERILVKEGAKVVIIPVDQIMYIEAQDDYAAIHSEDKVHLKQQRMAELEKILDSTKFVRIHRSYILNVEYLARIELYAKDSRVAILRDGTKLPISRSGYEKLKKQL